jgi:threonine synthase
VAPIASGALFARVHRGFAELAALGLLDGLPPRLYGGQAEGSSPVAAAFSEQRRVVPVRPETGARSLAIGNPADGDLAVQTARESGGAVYAIPEDEVGENMALLAERAGVFGETAAGVSLGTLLEAARRGRIGPEDEVVLLVTGDGLKTPEPVADRLRPFEIEADADALLERLGAA